jgi:hypothetical protein
VTYLCYFLEKGNRRELRELNLTGNPLGRSSQRALNGLKGVFSELGVLGVLGVKL